jgi:hypothetical protein
MCYETSVREKNAQAWYRLEASWKATFHSELTAGALEKWPTDGPHGFSKAQSTLAGSNSPLPQGTGKGIASTRPPTWRYLSDKNDTWSQMQLQPVKLEQMQIVNQRMRVRQLCHQLRSKTSTKKGQKVLGNGAVAMRDIAGPDQDQRR